MFQICPITPIPPEYGFCYSGMAFDGTCYYFIVKGKKRIVKTDNCFKNKEVFSTRRIYSSICYDSKENCLWVTSKNGYAELFKLNNSFQEIKHIRIAPICGTISGISYCCADNSIVVSTRDKILHMTKCAPPNTEEIWNCPGEFITGVVSLSPCCLYSYFLKNLQRIRIVTEDGSILEEIVPSKERTSCPKEFTIENMLYSGENNKYYCFQMLATENINTQYILELKIEKCIIGDVYPCNNLLFENCSPFMDSSNEIEELDDLQLPENFIECDTCPKDPCCNPCDTCPKDPCCNPCDTCPKDPCCNPCDTCPKDPCCNPCNTCPLPCPDCSHPCMHYYNKVLESIALEETAISHILNAEGEKIQKVLASTSCICEILEVNKEVNKTIVNITHLEHTLFNKLDSLCQCYNKSFSEKDCNPCSYQCSLEEKK